MVGASGGGAGICSQPHDFLRTFLRTPDSPRAYHSFAAFRSTAIVDTGFEFGKAHVSFLKLVRDAVAEANRILQHIFHALLCCGKLAKCFHHGCYDFFRRNWNRKLLRQAEC